MRDDQPSEPPDDEPGRAGTTRFTFSIGLLADPDADPDAHRREWTRVHAHFTARLDSFWRGRVPHDPERAELIQDTWVRTVPSVRKLRAPDVMWSWLCTVSERLYLDRARSAERAERQRGALEARELTPGAAVSDEPDALERLAHDPFDGWPGVDSQVFRERVAALSPDDRTMLRLLGEGHDHAEVACRLGIASADASRQRLRRIRRDVTGT